MKIGILGGTFNPPHMGHLILAQEILQKAELDKIFFVPTNIPPHKEGHHVSARDRIAMTAMMARGDRHFAVSDIEIRRGGISYTIDTVRELKNAHPKDEFFLIVGSDLANDFSGWRYFDQLKKEVPIIVAKRRDYPLERKGHFIIVGIAQMGISSSYIRSLIKKGFSVKYLVTEGVAKYIEKHRLYT